MTDSLKPPALAPGDTVRLISPASLADPDALARGCLELERLGYRPSRSRTAERSDAYFAGSVAERMAELTDALTAPGVGAVICVRGGYGSSYLLDRLRPELLREPRILIGYSDVTSLQSFLLNRLHWVTFYGPMVAAGLAAGALPAGGYNEASFVQAITQKRTGWTLDLFAQPLAPGRAEGRMVGGCLTLLETTLGTPWEFDATDAILLLEDRGLRPYQVDRALMHLKQAGKLSRVRGFLLGEFPDAEPGEDGEVTVRHVCQRILGELGVPVVWGAPIGHATRPILTIPLGVTARLDSTPHPQLAILEPAVC